MTSGWFQLHRGWRDSDVFGSEGPFSEREAWLWLIENAAWKPMTRTNAKGERIRIERGQMHLSLRQLEKVWGWGKNKVSRFLQRLEDHDMISGTASGQSGHIVTLCNYDVYQEDRDGRDSQTGTASGRSRDTQEKGIKPSEDKSSSETPLPASNVSGRVLESWNAAAARSGLTASRAMDAARRKALAARIKDHGEQAVFDAIANLAASKFHCGENDRNWKANLGWLLTSPTNFLKALEMGSTPAKPAAKPSPAGGTLFARLQAGEITQAEFEAERARLSRAQSPPPTHRERPQSGSIAQFIPNIRGNA